MLEKNQEYYKDWPSMMTDLASLCSDNNITTLQRVLSIIEGICRVFEDIPDKDIVFLFNIIYDEHIDWPCCYSLH